MVSDKITSVVNPRVKQVIRLRDAKERRKAGLTIIDGAKEILCALDSGINCREVFWAEHNAALLEEGGLSQKLAALKIPCVPVTANVFDKMAYGERGDGLLAVVQIPSYTIKDVRHSENPFYIVIEGVEKPGNLGAILRSCDGLGVDGVLISDPKTDLFNPNVIRASLGTVFSMKPVVMSNDDILAFFKSNKIKVFAADPSGERAVTQADFRKPSAIVVGSEHEGLSKFWKEKADGCLHIPMKGKADSFNVSISAALLIYEALRQRHVG